MPLNFGTNLSGKDADLMEDVINEQSIILTLTKRPILQFLFGEMIKPGSDQNLPMGLDNAPGLPQASQLVRWGGRGKRLRLAEEEGTWEDLADDFGAQAAGVTPTPGMNRGEAKFLYDLLHLDAWIPIRDWIDAMANPKKMDSLIAEKARAMLASLATKLSLNGFHGNGTPASDSLGSWRDLIATTGSYGGIDRTDANNANFVARQYTGFTIATWTYKKVISIIARSAEVGGLATLCPCTRTMYENVQDGVFQEFTPVDNDELVWIKGSYPRVGSLHFVLDADTGGATADENTTCALDSRYFRVMFRPQSGTEGKQRDIALSSFERNTNYKGMFQMQADIQAQIIHLNPKVNVGIYN